MFLYVVIRSPISWYLQFLCRVTSSIHHHACSSILRKRRYPNWRYRRSALWWRSGQSKLHRNFNSLDLGKRGMLIAHIGFLYPSWESAEQTSTSILRAQPSHLHHLILSLSTVTCVLPVSIRTNQLEKLNLVPALRNSKLVILAKCYSILIYAQSLESLNMR